MDLIPSVSEPPFSSLGLRLPLFLSRFQSPFSLQDPFPWELPLDLGPRPDLSLGTGSPALLEVRHLHTHTRAHMRSQTHAHPHPKNWNTVGAQEMCSLPPAAPFPRPPHPHMGIFAPGAACCVAAGPGKQLLLTQNVGWKKMRAEKGQGKSSMVLAQPPGPDVFLGRDEARLGQVRGSPLPTAGSSLYWNHCAGRTWAAGLEVRWGVT